MKVEVKDSTKVGQELYINDKLEESTGEGWPIINCVKLVKYMRTAYEAGKNGESFEYTILNEE